MERLGVGGGTKKKTIFRIKGQGEKINKVEYKSGRGRKQKGGREVTTWKKWQSKFRN